MIDFRQTPTFPTPKGWEWIDSSKGSVRELHRRVIHPVTGGFITDAVIRSGTVAAFPKQVWEAHVLSKLDHFQFSARPSLFPTYAKVLAPANDYMLLVDAVEMMYPSRMGGPVL